MFDGSAAVFRHGLEVDGPHTGLSREKIHTFVALITNAIGRSIFDNPKPSGGALANELHVFGELTRGWI